MNVAGGSTPARLGDGRTVEVPGLRRRRVARLVDALLLLPAMLCYVGYVVYLAVFGFAYLLTLRPEELETSALTAVLGWAGLLVLVLYEPVMVTLWGATAGKLAAGIRVVSFEDGSRVPWGSSWARVATQTTAGTLVWGVGWLVAWRLLPVARAGATVGPRTAGVEVVRWPGADPVGLRRTLLRQSASFVPLAVGTTALLWPWLSGADRGIEGWLAAVSLSVWALLHASVLWDPQRRGWRDRLTGTAVVTATSAAPNIAGRRRARTRVGDAMDERWQRYMDGGRQPDAH